MLGTVVNTIAVILGAGIGLFVKKEFLKELEIL